MYNLPLVKERRLELELTQMELATRSKLTVATISQIENGHKKFITPDTNAALTKALRMEADALLVK